MVTRIVIFMIALIVLISVQVKMNINFNQDCGGYLERAANANTVEAAHEQLTIALKYLEKNDLTSGYTSVLWKTPDEDLGFWYNNIKNADSELVKLPDSASGLEKSNMLIKLRETLMDHGKDGDNITMPDGISRYPSNGMYGLLDWIALIFAICFIIFLKLHEDY